MSFLSFKEHDIVLQIGSGGVSGAVVRFSKSALPKILYTHESQFPLKEKITADDLSTHMLAAFETVLKTLHQKHKQRVRSVGVVLASPWFSSFSKQLSLSKNSPFVVSQKIIEKLIDDQFKLVAKSGLPDSEIIIERVPSHIKLNGYELMHPYGKSATAVDVSVYASMVSEDLIKKFESEIHKIFHPESVSFHSLPFVAWNVIIPLFAPKEDFIFVDIGSEISDVLVVRHGSISSVVSLPMGKNHLVRKVAVHFDTHPELANTLINLYAHDTADVQMKEKMSTLVSAFGEEWRVCLQTAIQDKKSDHEHFLPQRSFFVSDQNISVIFNDILHTQTQNTIQLSRENFSQFVDFSVGETPNIFITLCSIYLNNRFSHRHIVYNKQHSLVK